MVSSQLMGKTKPHMFLQKQKLDSSDNLALVFRISSCDRQQHLPTANSIAATSPSHNHQLFWEDFSFLLASLCFLRYSYGNRSSNSKKKCSATFPRFYVKHRVYMNLSLHQETLNSNWHILIFHIIFKNRSIASKHVFLRTDSPLI